MRSLTLLSVRQPLTLACLLVLAGGLVSSAQETEPDKPFPEIYNSEKEPGDPVSPEQALAALELPEGFSATVFAAEPDVQNPIAACTDGRSRVWVAENFTYSERAIRFDLDLRDRVIVLEDTDGDGVSDRRTVFLDDLQVLTGITVGRGGVWLMCPPQLLFVPDADGDLVPDGPPQVILDGFHNARENYHNFANGLSWGPDSWLYGRCGASCPGDVGLPGSTDERRVPVRGGMWRYHPERQEFEALVQGTTNPWGHDWNELGDLFFINTVNGHFWHCIPGAHFVRPHTLDVNPHSYELIDMHADHWHFDTGKSWTASRDGAANDYGGGHAHIGMLVYQEQKWPERFQGAVLTVNMHGRRVNCETLTQQGSGYVASHAPDLLVSGDPWFRGMDLLPCADGDVLLLDWSDTGECHEQTGVHRTSGRIFKIRYDAASSNAFSPIPPATQQDLLELAKLQFSGSTWHSRRARERILELTLSADGSPAEQAAAQRPAAVALCRQRLLEDSLPVPLRLRGLWALMALNAVDEPLIGHMLSDPQAAIRKWAVRLLVDDWRLDTALGNRPADTGAKVEETDVETLLILAARETEPAVRLELASALSRLPLEHRAALAVALVTHAEDAEDHNLPLMVWYGLAPLGEEYGDALLAVLQECQWPTTRRLIARRVAEKAKSEPANFDRLFAECRTLLPEFASDVILGTARALAGWRRAAPPQFWAEISAKALTAKMSDSDRSQLEQAIQDLNVLFGDGQTIEQLIANVRDGQASLELRMSSLQSLVDSRASGLKELCMSLLNQRFLNSVAASGLARENDPKIGDELVAAYRRFHPSERPQVISILTTRKPWAAALLRAVEAGQIDRAEVAPFHARQIASLGDEALNEELREVWGQVRPSSDDIKQRVAGLRESLTRAVLAEADLQNGRALFQKTCGNCHRLYGVGGNLGPDLTGAQRSNLDYLLENIVDPSAVVTKEFRATVLLLDDDRVLTGLVTEQNDNTVTLATQNETFQISRDEIVQMKQSDQSTMPTGLLDQLQPQEIRDLFAYLQSTQQVAD